MESNFEAVARLLEDTEKRNERVGGYKQLFDALEQNLKCLDRSQRSWYEVQLTVRQQFFASLARLREVADGCSTCCTPDKELQLAMMYASHCHSAYSQLDFAKYEQFCTFIFF